MEIKENPKFTVFSTEVKVRPDDIDLNNHVHYSKYLDYILFARFHQMEENYKMGMEEFVGRGYSWVASKVEINFLRSLKLKDSAIVKTQVDGYEGAQVFINFWIFKKETNKLAAEGKVVYTLVSLKTGKPSRIPDDVIEKYTI